MSSPSATLDDRRRVAGIAIGPQVTSKSISAIPVNGRKLQGQMLAICAAGARSTALSNGSWRISGDKEFWFKQGPSTVVASSAGGSAYQAGGAIDFIIVTGPTDNYVHVVKGDDPTDGKVSLTLEE